MLKKIIIVFIIAIVIGILILLNHKRRDGNSDNSGSAKIKIAASFYALAEFAKQVGGDNVEITTIIPAGAEPHEYEPTPKDIAAINSARLFLYQGGGFDRWAEQAAKEVRLRGIVAVPMAESFSLRNNNPHIWLDPVLAQKEIEIIRGALASIDPQNADLYARNSARYIDLLIALDEKYKNDLADCAVKEIVAPHPAFQYLADRYGLSLIAVSASPEQEPSLRRVAEVIKIIRADKIKYIFTEPPVGSKISDVMAKEAGAKVLTLNPVEGMSDADAGAGQNYLSLMDDNLKNFKTALQCK